MKTYISYFRKKIALRILIVTHLLYPEAVGGREKYVKNLAETWSQNHEVGIIYYTRQQAPSSLIMKGIRIHRVLRTRIRLITQITYIITALLATLIHRYEILYVNSLFIPEFSALLNRILFHIPYVVAIHNPHELIPGMLPRSSSFFKNVILRNSAKIIAISKELHEMITNLGFLKRHKILHIPPGIEMKYLECEEKRLHQLESKIPSTELIPYVFTSRRLVWEKGIDVLLNAVKIMVDNGLIFKCIISGKGRDNSTLVQLARTLKIDSVVTFTGLVPEKELIRLISSAYCCVVPSRREGTPIALFEYMALGKPVVATKVGGIVDVLPDEDLIVPPENPTKLASAITRLLSDEIFSKEVAFRNKQRAKRYSYSRIADDLLRVFSEVLSCFKNKELDNS